MVSITDLKNIPLLTGQSDAILTKLATMATLETYEEGNSIYPAGAVSENLYFIKNGKAVLEAELAEGVSVSLLSLKPGYAFGWHSLFDEPENSAAVSVDTTDVIALPGDELRQLMDEDHDFGYQMMNRLVMLLKNRLDYRTDQFLRTLTRHPELNFDTV